MPVTYGAQLRFGFVTKNGVKRFFGVFLRLQGQSAPQGDIFLRMGFIVRIDHVFLNCRETVELNKQVDKAGKYKNSENGGQKQHEKVRKLNYGKNRTGQQRQFHNTYKQVLFKIDKGQQKAVFIDLGGGQIKGDDQRPHIVAHKREYNKADQQKAQGDIGKKAFGVEVKNQAEAQQGADQKIEDAHGQGLLPICLYRIKKVTESKGMSISGQVSGNIGDACLGQAVGDQQHPDHAVDKADGDKHPKILKPKLEETKKGCFLVVGVFIHN